MQKKKKKEEQKFIQQKRKVKMCINSNKKEANEQFGRKINPDVDGNWKR